MSLATRYAYRESADDLIVARGGSPVANPNPLGFTLTSPWGRPLNDRQFRKVFRAICAEAGVDSTGLEDKSIVPRPNTMRHTFLTHVAETAPPQSTMMAFVGQKDPRATQQYLGSTEAARREMLDDALRRLQIDDPGIERDSEASN